MTLRRILILGVTASGKGQLAFDLARSLHAEIVCVDSMKVYRRMDIGTAKPPQVRREQVPYHMIDLVEPSESFSVGLFLDRAQAVIRDIEQRGRPVVAVGGTALYIKALLCGLFDGPGADDRTRQALRRRADTEGLEALHRDLSRVDPEAASRIHVNDAKRIIRALEVWHLTGTPISRFQTQFSQAPGTEAWTVLGLRRAKAEEGTRINARVRRMIDQGLVQEVRGLLAGPAPLSPQAASAIGYAEIIEHLAGKTDLETATELIKKNTRRLAKAQRTWFKTFRTVRWLDIGPGQGPDPVLEQARACLGP